MPLTIGYVKMFTFKLEFCFMPYALPIPYCAYFFFCDSNVCVYVDIERADEFMDFQRIAIF